jgi:hypothetical protein
MLRLVPALAPVQDVSPAPSRVSYVAPKGTILDQYPFAETPLVVVFAASDDLSLIQGGSRVFLADTADISPDDAYLVLPQRARDSLISSFARGLEGHLRAWFDVAVVVRAELDGGRSPRLWVGDVWKVSDVFASQRGCEVNRNAVGDSMRVVNQLAHIEALASGGLLDARGEDTVTSRACYVGVGRMGVEEFGLGADAVEPTFVWSVREENISRVLVALSASEDDRITALLTPVTLYG